MADERRHNFVTRDEYIELKTTVSKIYSNLDSLTMTVVRLEESVKSIPLQIIATLPKELYNNCTRIAPVEKALSKIEGTMAWLIKTILAILVAAILGLVIQIPKV